MEEDNIFADIPREGQSLEELDQDVDKELQVETPAESQTEEEPDLKQNDTWREMREAREQAEQRAYELEQRLLALERGNEDIEQPEFLTDMIGENEEVARKYLEHEQSLKERIKAELIQDQIDAENKRQQEADRINKWRDDNYAMLEKEHNVNFSKDENLKNELAKTLIEYSPTDDQGNLDFRKGWKILTDLKRVAASEQSQRTQIKKSIADATVTKDTSTKEDKRYLDTNDLRGKDWRSLL
jgi:hypothetical protein